MRRRRKTSAMDNEEQDSEIDELGTAAGAVSIMVGLLWNMENAFCIPHV
jgi:hypothetical protein